MDIKKILGKNIQDNRKKKNYTQEELAETIGIDSISLSKIETGKNYPTSENLVKIAKTLNVEVYELFISNGIKSNEELLTEINNGLNKIAKNNQKLHVMATTINSLTN